MKLVNLYLIGVVVMIGFLVASTMWQYSQFQTNIKNLSFGVPQELTNPMANSNNQLSQLMNQIQTQPTANNNAGQTNATSTTETKQYTAPDNSFSFDYPADWTEQPTGNTTDTILFSASKTTPQSMMPSISYLTLEKTDATSTATIINQLKDNARSKQSAAKITESEIINGRQTIPVVEINQSITEPITKLSADINNSTAIITANNKFYILSIATQNDNQNNISERDTIFKSIAINSQKNNKEIDN